MNMRKIILASLLVLFGSQAMAQDDSTSVIVGFNLNGAIAPIANTNYQYGN